MRLAAMRSRWHTPQQRSSSSAPTGAGTQLMRTYGVAPRPPPRTAPGAGGDAWCVLRQSRQDPQAPCHDDALPS